MPSTLSLGRSVYLSITQPDRVVRRTELVIPIIFSIISLIEIPWSEFVVRTIFLLNFDPGVWHRSIRSP